MINYSFGNPRCRFFQAMCSWIVCACVVFIHVHFMSCSLHSFHLYFLFLQHHHLFHFNTINRGSIIKFPLWNECVWLERTRKYIKFLKWKKTDESLKDPCPKKPLYRTFFSQLCWNVGCCELCWHRCGRNKALFDPVIREQPHSQVRTF